MTPPPFAFEVDGRSLDPVTVRRVLAGGPIRPRLADEARARMLASRAVVERAIDEGRTVYGVNTGFGKLANQRIAPAQLRQLQINLLRSHACGVGTPLPDRVVRLALLFRANALAVGYSGVRPLLVETLLEMAAKDVLPRVPEQGSVGASGDLAPLAHLALPLIGEGTVRVDGAERPGGDAMQAAGIALVALEAKEGIALINGIQISTAIGAAMLDDADRLLRIADLAAAMSVDALLGSKTPFDPRIQAVRPHPGQATTARNVRALLEGSEILASHAGCDKVQDAYSLRCVPQVHGAARDALAHASEVVYREINAATDNPLVFAEEGEVLSGGNFHGEPVALVMDHAALAVHELGSISERRIESIVNPALSTGLPAFLAVDGGLQSGFMMAQVTAAALVCETRTGLGPASAESLPTSANQEDHVSLSPLAARVAAFVTRSVASILAIELLTATRGIEFRRPRQAGRGIEAAMARLRARVPAGDDDVALGPMIDAVRTWMLEPGWLSAVENVAGPLEGIPGFHPELQEEADS